MIDPSFTDMEIADALSQVMDDLPGAVPRIAKGNDQITTLDDWLRLAPPAMGERHWKDGRSAKELARRWLEGVPPEVLSVLRSHPFLEDIVLTSAEPECHARLDSFSGPRCHDLLVQGTARNQPVVMGVEGKADESFGPTIARALASPSPSRRPERAVNLIRAIFGTIDASAISRLRYQLLHGLAGTMVSAGTHGVQVAIFLVHEFRTASASLGKIARNRQDLESFLEQLGPADQIEGESGFIAGPFRLPGYGSIPAASELFVAKAVTAGLG
jgi:hypothetical protein